MLLSFVLIFVCTLSMNTAHSLADAGADVTFSIGGNATGTVQYKIGATGTWTTIGDGESINDATISGGDIYLKATPESGAKLDDYEGQNHIRYDDTDYAIDLDALKAGTYSFAYENKSYHVQIKFDHDGGGQGGNDPEHHAAPPNIATGKYRFNIEQQVEGSTGTVKVEFLDSGDNVLQTVNASASTEETDIPSGAVKVRVSMADEASKDILNNIRLEGFPREEQSEVDLIDDIRQSDVSVQDIDPANKGYEIRVTFSNTMSVSWSYDPSAAEDQYVEHARIELLNSDNATDFRDEGRTDWQLTTGETYYFVLIPDYGYQVSGLNINGQPIEPMNSVGVFKFVMSHSNFHFQGIVERADDQTVYNQDGLLGGLSIDANNVVNSGNVRLKETDVAADANALTAVSDSGATLFGSVDLSLDQIISKGNGSYWETELSETSKAVTVRVVVPAGELQDGETYTIVREHNGVYEELQATYYLESEELVFETDKFSTYSIIKKSGTSAPGESPASSAPVSNLSDSVGGVVIENWYDLSAVIETTPEAVRNDLVEIVVNYKNTTVPQRVFQALAESKAKGIHMFTGNGTALTFANTGNIASQPEIDLTCQTTESAGKKTISFKSYDSLVANVLLHSIVPEGTSSVKVFYTGTDGIRKELYTLVPTKEGRFCFPINTLGLYEIEY